jgi:4,5-DOPA dioxygenase extradiol
MLTDPIMPALFIGHGNPMNAIEDNEFSRLWQEAAKNIPKPKAILCISAHWETRISQVTAMDAPRTIHDFYGFPRALFEVQYPALGSPQLVRRIVELAGGRNVAPDSSWGLDHGTWSVLCRMYPEADIPVVQLSLSRNLDGAGHYALGQQLKQLRREGVLVLGSGNIVHNLGMMVWEDTAFDWAVEYDAKVARWILLHEHEPLIHYEQQGQAARLAVNSAEHYLPLLYILGVSEKDEPVSCFADKLWGGSLSMRCVRIG